MKVKFVSTTNEAMKPLYEYEGDLYIGMQAQFDFKLSEEEDRYAIEYPFWRKGIPGSLGRFTTSMIEKIKYIEISRNCWVIKIQTYNSTYVFQKGEKSKSKPIGKRSRQSIAMGMFL
jgi:hypothetical protein